MKHCEFNFTMKAIHCIYWELKGQTKSVKVPGSKGISCLQYTVHVCFFFFLSQYWSKHLWFLKQQCKIFILVYLNVNFKALSNIFLKSEMIGEWTIILKEMSSSRTHNQVLNTLAAFIGAIPLSMKVKFLHKIPGSDPSLLWGSE